MAIYFVPKNGFIRLKNGARYKAVYQHQTDLINGDERQLCHYWRDLRCLLDLILA